MALSDTAIRTAKSGPKPRRLYDEKGLYIEVSPKGGKWWRFKYRFHGKAKLLSLGTYPAVSLKKARSRRDDARMLLEDDIDPSQHRKQQKAASIEADANSFEAIAREWYVKHSPGWAPNHANRILRRLERDIFPYVGTRPIADLKAPELLAVIRRIESRGALETAHRALGNCSQVIRYAVATGRAERDPCGDLRGALPPPSGTHFAAATDPDKLAGILRAVDGYEGTPVVRAALRLAPLVFVRPGELRAAKWADIDLEAAEWRFTVSKTGQAHIVPLSSQAVAILRELQPLTGRSEYVFPSARSAHRPMSDNAVLAALRRLGIGKDEMSGHGFRASARTILDEVLNFRADLIEHQLAHAVRDPLGRAYNRTAHLPERKKMMQAWSDYLDTLKAADQKVVPLHRRTT